MIEAKEECKVVIYDDRDEINHWRVDTFGYGTWMKMIGFMGGTRATYYFENEAAATMFSLKWK